VIERNAVAKMRKVDGVCGLFGQHVDGVMNSWRNGKANVVEGLMWSVAGAGDDGRLRGFNLDIGIAKHFDGAISEDSGAVVVTDSADR
jgi:hypothetical protein